MFFFIILLLTSCSYVKENKVNEIQIPINSDLELETDDTRTSTLTTTPTLTPKARNNINVEDNEILSNLRELCKTPRKFDTDGEQRALGFLTDKMIEYGYETQIQEFPVFHIGDEWISPESKQVYFEKNRDDANKFGTARNIIAAGVNTNNKMTLYIVAHYDTTEDTNGIRDNGSGVVVAMEIARQLQLVNLPINVKFVFFSAEEAGLQGSTYFVSHLTQEERENALGCINIDVVGQRGDNSVFLKTCSSQINVLSILMNDIYNFHHAWSEASDHKSFFLGDIPAIYFADNKVITKDNTDNPLEELDIEKLKVLTKTICEFVINFNLNDYNNLLKNSYIQEYANLPETKEVLGYSLIQANKILKSNGAGSDIQYIFNNEYGNQLVIIEQDKRFLNEDEFSDFEIYNEHVRYKVTEEENNIIIKYMDDWAGLRYYILEGNITADESLELLNQIGEVTNYGILNELD